MPTHNIHNALREAVAELIESASPRLDAEVLLAHILGVERSGLYRHPNRLLTGEEIDCFQQSLNRRKKGEPVAYITGQKEFWSLAFNVTPHVLIPRPDTETLVEETLRICRMHGCRNLLEIGTGSGAISVALAAALEDIIITATDLSQNALDIASKNAVANGVADRIVFLQGNVFEPVSGQYDVIVSNPPYISNRDFNRLPVGVRDFEPACALVAGPEGTEFHRLLIEGGRNHLIRGGWLLMEFGVGQKDRIEEMYNDAHYSNIYFIKDLSDYDRVAAGRKE